MAFEHADHHRVQNGMRSILPGNVTVVSSRRYRDEPLMPGEEEVVARAVQKRRAEFTTGRACARDALRQLGCEPAAINRGVRGEPVWPAGIVGSITHCAGYYAAAVARADCVAAVGIDAEPHEPLPDGVHSAVLTSTDKKNIRMLHDSDAGGNPQELIYGDRLVFSAKESVYKVWYPLMGTWLGFEEVTISVETDGRFRASLPRAVGAQGAYGDQVVGRWSIDNGIVLTAIVLAP